MDDPLSPFIGEIGRWQLFIYLAIGAIEIPGAMQIFVMTFYTPNLSFWCTKPSSSNMSVEEWRNFSSPMLEVDDDGQPQYDACLVYKHAVPGMSNATDGNATMPCHHWEYDMGIYHRTMREEVINIYRFI